VPPLCDELGVALCRGVQKHQVVLKSFRDLRIRSSICFGRNSRVPKLRLKLSPAELDESLLELYDKISEIPSGDVLRLISGGGGIALQNLYMIRQAQKEEGLSETLPYFLDDVEMEENGKIPVQCEMGTFGDEAKSQAPK
jgi:hypothetical protein